MPIEGEERLEISGVEIKPDQVLGTLRRSIFWVSLPFGILSFALPIYGVEIGADAVQIGLFFSAFFFMLVLMRPVVGVALDRYGRRPFFITGVVGYTVTMFAFAYADQVWALMLARALQGAAASFLWLSVQAMTADVAEEDDRGRSFGSVEQSSSQGAILGTFIGFGVLVSLGFIEGWGALFIGYGIASLLAALLAWRNLKETQPTIREQKSRPIRWSRPWVLLLLVTVVTAAAWTMVSPILMIFLQERLSAGVQELALAYLPAALVWALLPTRLGRLADRFGRKPLMILGLVVAAITSFLVPALTSLALLAILWGLQALSYAAGDPAEQALVADLTDGDQRGRAYGLYAMAGGLGATFGPLVGGWLYETVGPRAPFYANGLVLAACAQALALLLHVPAREPVVD